MGIRDSLNGQEAVRNTVGPMAHSLKDIEIWCKAVVDSQSHVSADPDCLPIPWRDYQIPQKLCFGEFLLMRLDRLIELIFQGFYLKMAL